MLDPYDLLRHIADGAFYSGQSLANRFGVSRMTICQSIHKLEEFGIDVDAVRGRGYRLQYPLELLDAQLILKALNEAHQQRIPRIDIFSQIDSTNSYLLQQASQGAPSGLICLAECQSAGKGRRGRSWISPFGRNLYLSLLWRFESNSTELSGLSLLIGLAVAGVIQSLGVNEVCLKWPNDILCQGRKLAGILLEMSGELDGRCHVVIGIGINVSMPVADGQRIEQPWADLTQFIANSLPSRNLLAASIIESVVTGVTAFERQGLKGLMQAWHSYDCFYGKTVELHQPKGTTLGTALGIDELGRLKLNSAGVERVYASGEITLRLQP